MLTIDLGDGTVVEKEIPPITCDIPPGGVRYSFLPHFYPTVILEGEEPWDMEKCRTIKAKKGLNDYTWQQFLREINFMPFETAVSAYTALTHNTTSAMRAHGLPMNAEFIRRSGAETYARWWVGWERIAQRYWWYEKALVNGLPDPLYEPIPPLMRVGAPYIDQHMKRVSKLSESLGRGSLELISNAILYGFGYIPGKPSYVREESWEKALRGLFSDPFPMISMACFPGEYLNHIAEEEQSGANGFFSTPLSITELMSQLTIIDRDDPENATPDDRKRLLMESINEPCVGAGNMLWGFWNDRVKGIFTDVSPVMVTATRAMCALYAPWFVQSTFCVNSLIDPGEMDRIIKQQYLEYRVDETIALASHQQYVGQVMENHQPDAEREMETAVILNEVATLDHDDMVNTLGEPSQDEERLLEMIEKVKDYFAGDILLPAEEQAIPDENPESSTEPVYLNLEVEEYPVDVFDGIPDELPVLDVTPPAALPEQCEHTYIEEAPILFTELDDQLVALLSPSVEELTPAAVALGSDHHPVPLKTSKRKKVAVDPNAPKQLSFDLFS